MGPKNQWLNAAMADLGILTGIPERAVEVLIPLCIRGTFLRMLPRVHRFLATIPSHLNGVSFLKCQDVLRVPSRVCVSVVFLALRFCFHGVALYQRNIVLFRML